ncbi:MAG: YicC/YloC family endoribonuclease [Bacteroidota bacterium]|jgi:uncharacterized protein (TIGR00255 family)
MKSMTGYSKAEYHEKGISTIIELKSVNGRYLETSVKLPRSLSHREIDIREMIRKALNRGTISAFIVIESAEGDIRIPKMNLEKAMAIHHSLLEMQKQLHIETNISIDNMLQFSQHFLENDKDDTSELQWEIVCEALKKALIDLEISRGIEGKELAKDMLFRVDKILQDLLIVEHKSAERIPEEREKMRQKIALLFEKDEIDELRIQQEIIFLADKLDVSEECVRLRSHIKFFHELAIEKEPIGRKLNFLLQEMNREVNTIGSKANDIEIAHIVVGMKEELERIREQVQNIE